MTQKERLLAEVMANSDAFENMAEPGNLPATGKLVSGNGTPQFEAQFDLNFYLRFYTEAAGVFTEVLAADLPAALKQKFPAILWGLTDFDAGFIKSTQQYALQGGWAYGAPQIYGKLPILWTSDGIAADATVKSFITFGDMVFTFKATFGGDDYHAFLVVNNANAPYSTNLSATSSNKYNVNGLRYQLNDQSDAAVLQFKNKFGVYRNSMFGRFITDTFNPLSYKQAKDQQRDILDLPFQQTVDKDAILSIPINYDRRDGVVISVFVMNIEKI